MIKKFSFICALAALSAVMSARVAKADDLDDFTYTSNGNTFFWQLPSSPTPDYFDPLGGYFTISASYSENGIAAPTPATFDFYAESDGGGFDSYVVPGSFLINAYGPVVFTGSVGTPTFTSGTFPFTDYATIEDGAPGTLAIPEPSTVELLAIGFVILALGFTLKRAGATQIQS